MYDASANKFSVPGKQFFPPPARRVRFRLWTENDRENFRRLNRNSRVMRFFPAPLSARASDALLERFMAHQQEEGFGVWPVEVLPEVYDTTERAPRFAGFAGLLRVRFAAPFSMTSQISDGGFCAAVSFSTICVVIKYGILEKTLYVPFAGRR